MQKQNATNDLKKTRFRLPWSKSLDILWPSLSIRRIDLNALAALEAQAV
jgi:hypothetical protein